MKLKTLKDIDKGLACVFRDELKAEAIKWVKYHAGLNSVKLFIDFFNITEEDLK